MDDDEVLHQRAQMVEAGRQRLQKYLAKRTRRGGTPTLEPVRRARDREAVPVHSMMVPGTGRWEWV